MENLCKRFETFNSFEHYVSVLRDAYGYNVTADALQGCKHEICSTLYSTGNSDVSGIGVIVGFYLEFALAILLGVGLLVSERARHERLSAACRAVTAAFADSAIALALSVELASVIMLIKKNFGLGSNDFGALTVQLVWIVALLVMLPITTFCWQDLRDRRFELRVCTISLTFILFLVTFVCRMISTYSDGQVGPGDHAVLTESEMEQIELLCLMSANNTPTPISKTIEVFSIGGSLWISCLVLAALVTQCLHGSENVTVKKLKAAFSLLKDERRMLTIILLAMIMWSVPLFWTLMELRRRQEQFAADLGQPNGNKTWTFGQILAVVVFVPVLVEMLNQYMRDPRKNCERCRASDMLLVGSIDQDKR